MTSIGVFICHCGLNIASTIDVQQVAEVDTRLERIGVQSKRPTNLTSRAHVVPETMKSEAQ